MLLADGYTVVHQEIVPTCTNCCFYIYVCECIKQDTTQVSQSILQWSQKIYPTCMKSIDQRQLRGRLCAAAAPCEYKAGEDRWSCAGFSGQRLERKTWRNELSSRQQRNAPFPPSRCHARPSSLGLGPRGPPLNRAAGSLQRRGPSEDGGLMFSSWITSTRLALVSVCRGERTSFIKSRQAVSHSRRRERGHGH